MDQTEIEKLIRRMAVLPNSLKTVLAEQDEILRRCNPPTRVYDETQALYEETEVVPRPKPKRKTDKRTLSRRAKERRTRERADKRREDEGGLRGQFMKLRREYIRRARKDARPNSEISYEWNLSLDEWLSMWLQAGSIGGVPAWKLKGRRSWCDVQLRRLDVMIPFQINNLQIKRGKQVLFSGDSLDKFE